MAEDQKNTPKGFQNFCEGMDFAEIMRKMMEDKKAGRPFNCSEMMSQMMQICCGAGRKKKGSTPETKENPAPGQQSRPRNSLWRGQVAPNSGGDKLPVAVEACPSMLVLEMATFGRSTAYGMVCLAVLFGGGSLIAFLAFLLAGSPELLSLNLRANEVLWQDMGLCIAFFFQHSGMVRKSFRQRLAQFLPVEYESAVYAIVSGIALLVLMVLWQKSGPTLTEPRGVIRWLFYITYFLSFAGFIWGSRTLGVFDPYGLRPILGRLRGKKPRRTSFVVKGPYRWVRHPLYLFMIWMVWSCPDLTADRLLFNGLWTVWIVIGSILEERDLVLEFGDVYREYQRRVPMFIPRRFHPLPKAGFSS